MVEVIYTGDFEHCWNGLSFEQQRAVAHLVFDPARQAVLLVGGDKTGRDRFYREMIRAAERIYAEFLREIGQG